MISKVSLATGKRRLDSVGSVTSTSSDLTGSLASDLCALLAYGLCLVRLLVARGHCTDWTNWFQGLARLGMCINSHALATGGGAVATGPFRDPLARS